MDPEDEYFPEEITKLERDVREKGLSIIVFGEWFSEAAIKSTRFYDDNTRSWWDAVTGGANVPALNDLLKPFGVALGSTVWDGVFTPPASRESITFGSGNAIVKFPSGAGWLLRADGLKPRLGKDGKDSKQGGGHLRGGGGAGAPKGPGSLDPPFVLGAMDVCLTDTGCAGSVTGTHGTHSGAR